MSVKINLGAWSSVFAVPSKIVDEGLKFSDGVKLKVLLFVLRNSGRELSEKEISDATGVNVTDIPEALEYWVTMGVLKKDNDGYKPEDKEDEILSDYNSKSEIKADNNSNKEIKAQSDDESNGEEPKQKFTVSRLQKPDYVFTTQRLAVDEELKFIVGEAELALGKALSNSDISTLLMLKDTCGLPVDVILMLIHYCVSIDKGNMRTVEKFGVQWANDGVDTVEAADNKIRRASQSSKNFSIVSSAFGLKNVGSPTKKQLEYGDKWVGEWKFSPEMLREAYERCVDNKGEVNFRYIDGILKRWNSSNIKTSDALKSFESKPQAKSAYKQKSSFDIDELEKIDTLDNL